MNLFYSPSVTQLQYKCTCKPAGGQPTDTGTITSIDGSIIFEVKCWSGLCLCDNFILLASCH